MPRPRMQDRLVCAIAYAPNGTVFKNGAAAKPDGPLRYVARFDHRLYERELQVV